ncbi:hypothetical protein [Candidatus Nitrosopumilus sediminis]|uniref:Uncharacterized protein n=1 Tax=Candidatus Nitrosopumilus sediminis TaxID=1229909 RepID=K0B8R3_9ARCH|nr:hypothetical protein [Candidatus Nitrosopumilus sediminis]AFS82573.1 hypothetical protein NSED_03835 [Candidatus Nitrosopumilus sediminis]
MKTKLLIIAVGMAVFAGVGIAYGINQYDYYQDQKQYEEWRDIRESILSEIRETKIRNHTVQTMDVGSMSDEERCAWTFDNSMNEFVREQEKYRDSPNTALRPLSEDQIVPTSIQFAKWRGDGCAFSIPEWAHLSIYEDWVWENIAPTFKIRGLHSRMVVDEPMFITIEKMGYDMCDSWDARIVDFKDNSTMWEKMYHSGCVIADHTTPKLFQYTISNDVNPVVISTLGNYTFQIEIGHTFLKKDFAVIEYFEDIVMYDEWDR